MIATTTTIISSSLAIASNPTVKGIMSAGTGICSAIGGYKTLKNRKKNKLAKKKSAERDEKIDKIIRERELKAAEEANKEMMKKQRMEIVFKVLKILLQKKKSFVMKCNKIESLLPFGTIETKYDSDDDYDINNHSEWLKINNRWILEKDSKKAAIMIQKIARGWIQYKKYNKITVVTLNWPRSWKKFLMVWPNAVNYSITGGSVETLPPTPVSIESAFKDAAEPTFVFPNAEKVPYGWNYTYIGQMRNNKMHGQGKLIKYEFGKKIITYDGNWKRNKRHGYGKKIRHNPYWLHNEKTRARGKIFDDHVCYEGEFKDNLKHGQGKYTSTNGGMYEGEWKDDLKHGQGKLTFANGAVYEGEWKDDLKHGQGKYTFANGDMYEGEFKDDEPWELKKKYSIIMIQKIIRGWVQRKKYKMYEYDSDSSSDWDRFFETANSVGVVTTNFK